MPTKKLSPAREKLLRRVEAGDLLKGAAQMGTQKVILAWFDCPYTKVTPTAIAALKEDLVAMGPRQGHVWEGGVTRNVYALHLTEAGKAALAAQGKGNENGEGV